MKAKIGGLYSGLLLLFFSLVMFSGCDRTEEKIELPQVVTLSVDKNTIKSDGVDFITFYVMADDVDVSDAATIVSKDEGDKAISDRIFFTDTPGTYTFYSIYRGIVSETIEVEVRSPDLSLSSDVSTIKADGISSVTFSVTEYGESITDMVEIYYIGSESDVKLEGNIFNTTEEGVFEFYSKYNERVSNTVSIEAVPLVLTLIPDVQSFKANGTDVVSFTVMLEEEDVTEFASVYMANGNDDYVIENNVFSTEMDGLYGFYAIYNDKRSENITVKAIVSNLVITPDIETVRTGRNVTFTAISDNVDDVSPEIELVIIKDEKEVVVSGNIFTPSVFGVYSIYAKYDGKVSKPVQINVLVATVSVSADKKELRSTGSDFARFTVLADGIQVNDAEVFVKSASGDQKLVDNRFSADIYDTYTFYAKFQDVKSADINVKVNKAAFKKRTCAMEAVATWCGFSPQMMEIFNAIHESSISERILTVTLHRTTSELVSLDVNGNALMSLFNITGVPLGVMDFDRRLLRNMEDFENSYLVLRQGRPVTSGVAITSQKNGDKIDVTLKVKANETGDYSIGAIIVEDNVVHGQLVFPDNDKSRSYTDYHFVHHGLATYIMPGTSLYPGQLIGSLGGGRESTVSFSIDLNRKVVDRTVNYSNCRVVAYVMKKDGSKYFINNAASCSINGSIGYNHE